MSDYRGGGWPPGRCRIASDLLVCDDLVFRTNSAFPFRLLAPSVPSSMSAPSRCPPRLSSTTSHPRLTLPGIRGIDPGPGGFALHSVTRLHRPPLFSTTRGSATLCPLPGQGSPFPSWLDEALGNFKPQSRSASRGKARHLLVSRPASVRFGSSNIGTCSITPARPPPHTHIAGSLFATYTSSASCFLQTPHLWRCPCLVGVVLPSDTVDLPATSARAPCPAHVNHYRLKPVVWSTAESRRVPAGAGDPQSGTSTLKSGSGPLPS